MKLIISSDGPHATSLIDPRFGRARFLIQFDSSTQSYISRDNSEQVEATHGADLILAFLAGEIGRGINACDH